ALVTITAAGTERNLASSGHQLAGNTLRLCYIS
ncbi:hypothetical protein MPER_06093, partial [Moniliophthora perniciosa FA553]